MIKSLFGENSDHSEQNKKESVAINDESKIAPPPAPNYIEVNEAADLIENSSEIDNALLSNNSGQFDEDEFESLIEKINNAEELTARSPDLPLENIESSDAEQNLPERVSSEKQIDETEVTKNDFAVVSDSSGKTINQSSLFESFNEEAKSGTLSDTSTSSIEPQSLAETARQSGLAYAAALTLFASVVFMLIIGWFADLLFGSSPWGKVGGIVIGSLIGFVQLFRITSQIFKNKN